MNLEVERRGKLGVLRADLNLAEALTELKRSASPVAHIDQQVNDAKKLLPQLERHGRLAVRKVLDQTGNARGEGRAAPALQRGTASVDHVQNMISEPFRWVDFLRPLGGADRSREAYRCGRR